MQSFVIVHPQDGVYLGYAMGLGFFAKLDSVGQTQAAVFPSEQAARDHIASWDDAHNPDGYRYVAVTTDHAEYATIAELKHAGLADMLGDMEDNFLLYCEPQGSA
jgi:hypothetical protein